MEIWSAVYLYRGIITDMKLFRTKEAAKKYFDECVEDCGGVEACEPEWYMDGSNGRDMYFFDGDDDEIEIMLVEVEG